MGAPVLIVDGHNVVHQWHEVAAQHARSPLAAREHLIRVLVGLHDASDWHVVLVFDGRGPEVGEEHVPDGVQVFYSDSRRSADHLIERLVVLYSGKYSITVVSDDVLVCQVCAACGAEVTLSTDGLRDLVEDSCQRLREDRSEWFRQ